jgi:penicillin-binding protein 1A
MMTDVLKDVVLRGTGRNAKVKGIELAGKTGTTNNNVDAWFCGYSPSIEVISWVGRDDNKPIGKGATGGAMAAPAFAYYYKELLKLYPDTKRIFDIPEGVFKSEYEGIEEYYTAHSPLPEMKREKPKSMHERYIESSGDFEDEDSSVANTIRIHDEPIVDINDALHPKRKVLTRPVSRDSGELF